MRIDKYLKIARIIKRRTLAKQMADQGRVVINEKTAKSSTPVNVGDKVVINFGNKTLTVKVLAIKETTKKAEASELFSVVSEEYAKDFRD